MTDEQKTHLRKALEVAQQRRNELICQRSLVEGELAQQSRAIAALKEVLGDPVENDLGLTAATLLIVRTAQSPLAPTEVRDELKKIGFDLAGYSNPMASLHQILKRLEEKGEIQETDDEGKKRYRVDPTVQMVIEHSAALNKMPFSELAARVERAGTLRPAKVDEAPGGPGKVK